MGKMMSPNTRIDWILDAAYDPAAPSAAKFTAATNISCAIESGYTLNPTKSDLDTSTTICDVAKRETPTRYNYEGSLTFSREGDLADTTSDWAKAFAFFKNVPTTGYLVRRTGMKSSVAVAAGQRVDSFKFVNDVPQDEVDDNLVKYNVKFVQQGRMELNTAVVA